VFSQDCVLPHGTFMSAAPLRPWEIAGVLTYNLLCFRAGPSTARTGIGELNQGTTQMMHELALSLHVPDLPLGHRTKPHILQRALP
jgi:hypothetical protein